MTKTVNRKISIAGIGCSAGGIQALQTLFRELPPDLGIAYAVIAHLSPTHKSELSQILGRETSMPVTEVRDSDSHDLETNHVYVISPDRKLEITDTTVSAAPFDQPRGQRAAIDLFFRSLARTHGDGFAVVLSGGGTDGCLGAKAVKEAGGLVLVQDPQEAEHRSMPEAVIAAGLADAERLVQVLDNLVRNAINFTDRGGEITVSVTRDGDWAAVSVRDTGTGIDPAEIDSLFEPYRQVDGGHRSDGLGLGLTLARRLTELQGGRISATSEGLGRGSEFSIRLPRVEPTNLPAPRQHVQAAPARRILIVDDNTDSADALSELLRLHGHEVQVAYDADTATTRYETWRPTAVFIDIMMPDVSGVDLARRLRHMFSGDELFLVAMSGRSMNDADSLFDVCLLKPVTLADVNKALR